MIMDVCMLINMLEINMIFKACATDTQEISISVDIFTYIHMHIQMYLFTPFRNKCSCRAPKEIFKQIGEFL